MSIKKILLAGLTVVLSAGLLLINSPLAKASWNQNNIIVDPVFDNSGTMNIGDIQNFLNQFPSSCLRTYQAPFPNGYNSYGGNVSAATVIRRAADIYGVNPEVILATLQKESSVVTGDCTYINTAMGMGCPDGGACPAPGFEGFSQQVTKGTWLLKFGKERANGNVGWTANDGAGGDPAINYSGPMTQGCKQRKYDAPVVCYDGFTTIDGVSVHVDTGSTASFYNYTPHLHGNQLFVSIFESWFGSTQTTIPYAWTQSSVQIYANPQMTQGFSNDTTVAPGGKVYVRIVATNTGNQTWNQSTLHLGTYRPAQHTSQFYDSSWLNPYRPAQLVESSVPPGSTGTFEFTLSAPSTPGTYQEYFDLVAENITWLNDLGSSIIMNVVSPAAPNNANHSILQPGEVLHPSEFLLSPDGQSTLNVQDDGNLVLYSDFKSTWNTVTFGKAIDRLEMGIDGNLVLYFKNGTTWSTNTQGNPGAYLKLQTDGNLVLYDANNAPLWNTVTFQTPDNLSYVNTTLHTATMFPGQQLQTADRRYRLVFQTDGNLVLYSPNRALWSSNTQTRGSKYVKLQGDGNLVIYDGNNHPLWNTVTFGNGSSRLVMQADGNLVLYGSSGRAVWNTVTFNQL
ncbi:MAG TPA: NBR1-Ig-like domain-containing protein [Patescibacteria group bacterium]|nr:NBR1-Ig-like domain-containing protein [Patescibacteria group bacterium]